MSGRMWRLPLERAQRIAGSAGPLSFVGGAGDYDHRGLICHPGDAEAQLDGAIANAALALGLENCGLGDAVRLKVYYSPEAFADEWALLAALARHFSADPLPAITLHPVPLQPFAHQLIQIQAIAQRGWRGLGAAVRAVQEEVPAQLAAQFGGRKITRGLRAGEFLAVAARVADTASGIEAAGDGIGQSRVVMERLGQALNGLGASFQDCVKMEGYYFGNTLGQWAGMAKMRASFFREPGPVATVVPCHVLRPEGALTKIEVMGLRESWNGFDKYIPREDRWPRRVWDWPVPLPYRQAIRLRDMIWLGGQVPYKTFSNAGETALPGELLPQTEFTMSYIDDLLSAFDRTAADLQMAVGYFTSQGTEDETRAFLNTVAHCVPGPLPPFTVVPQPHMHTDDMTVEIWGIARG